MNPITLIDTLMSDYVPAKYRRLVHALILIVAAGVTIWMAADGDWRKALIAAAAAIYAAVNKANTPATDLSPAGGDFEPDDGLSYEEAGGLPYDAEDESALYGRGGYDEPIPGVSTSRSDVSYNEAKGY